jgi:glucose-1-phosphate adenylyltransferase
MEHGDWFQGSADAVRKCYKHFNDPRIKYLVILSGDQLYKMDLMEMLNFHKEKKSEVTVACNLVSAEETSDLGIMGIQKEGRIKKFVEKPRKKEEIAGMAVEDGDKKRYLASMGIYIFNKDALIDLLKESTKVDFGREVIPEAVEQKKTYAFIHRGYWKDIGSIQSFYEENLAFTEPKPPLDLFDESWHFFTRPRHLPPSKLTNCRIENSSIADGVIIDKAEIYHSTVGLRSEIGPGTQIYDSILMGNDYYTNPDMSGIRLGIGKNCLIKKAIIDKNASVGNGVKLINEKKLVDFENQYCVIRSGIIIIPKNTVIPEGMVI